MKSTTSIPVQKVQRQWVLIDASEQPLGRLGAKAASYLIGKNKAFYTPHMDSGDYVVVINSDKVKLSGLKEQNKLYYRHSGYPGGLRSETVAQMREKDSRRLVEKAIKGMLPKNKLGAKMLSKLHVYKGADHGMDRELKKVEVNK
jgi:large subunit ribosomal protein L13